MLNVKTLTDTMSRMQLPQLQQYAALHKNDPYIVTLALSIANQKKQMQAGQAGQAGMMPQPKVVDQDIAQMSPPPARPMGGMPQGLPEDSGIGQLPAQNMQGMAAGGIVAFEEGGDVPGYATGVFTGEENIPDWLKVFPPESGIRRTYRAMNQYDKNNPMPVYPTVPATAPAAAPALPPSATQVMSGLPTVKTPSSIGTPPPPSATETTPTVKPINPVVPSNAGLAALNTTPLTPEQAMTAGQKFGDEAALKAGIARLDTDAVNTNASIQAAHEKGLAALPKPGEEAEARLKAREAQDVVGQADAKAMAIFKAGLGMMAGTSQHAFENIGKGAMAGLEDYSASIKDFRKLGIERDKAYADIEAARNAAARDDFKTSIGLQEKGADRLARAHEKGIDLTASLFKTDKETAATIYRDSFDQAQQNLRTQATEAGATGRTLIQERGANTRAQMGSPLNLYSKLGGAAEGSPLLKGYNIAKNEGSMERLFESYNKLANDPLNGTYFKAQHPTFESYVRNYQSAIGTGGGSGFVPLPANATVLPPK
jgi:hypothetical protein